MLTVPDSLFTANPDRAAFFFLVFTKSMNGSDGFYSEALGMSSFNYLSERTQRFAHIFSTTPELTDADLENWASYVHMELGISRGDDLEVAVRELTTHLSKKAAGMMPAERTVINKLIAKIKSFPVD